MKRIIYIAAFTFLGLLVATFVHGIIELPLLRLMTNNFEQWGDSFLWQNWQLIHAVGGGVLWLAGLGFGLWGGVRYWRIVYSEQKR